MSTVTVGQLDELIKQIHEKEAEHEKATDAASVIYKECERLKMQAVGYLKDLGRNDFDTPYGKFEIITRVSVKVPATDGDKAAFFDWLREREIFDRYATVNSRSLQSLYKKEREQAEKQGEDMITWTIPGLQPPTISETTKLGNPKKKKVENEDE